MARAVDERWTARAAILLMAVAIAAGALFRLWNLAGTSLWLDEAYSRFAADHGFAFLWHVVPRYETHPPFYYSLLHLWRGMFGDAPLALRMPSLLSGAAALAVMGLCASTLARRLDTDRAGRAAMIGFAVALFAIHPMLIDMHRQARPYAVMILVYGVATLALLRLAQAHARSERPPRGWIVLYFITQTLMLWLHSLGPLFAMAMTLALACILLDRRLTRADWLWLLGAQTLAGLAYVPAFLILIGQAPTWVHSTWLQFKPGDLPLALVYLAAGQSVGAGLAMLIALVAGAARITLLREGTRLLAALLLLALLPVLLSILLSLLVSPVFLTRTLSPIATPLLLIAAATLGWRRRAVAAALLAIPVLTMTITDARIAALAPGENWNAVVAWLVPRVGPDDAIWAYPNESALPLGYAFTDKNHPLPIRQIPAPVPALDSPGAHPTGTPGVVALDRRQIAALIAAPATHRPRTIWLVQLNGQAVDPNNQMLKALLRERMPIAVYHVNAIRITGLRRRGLASVAMPQQAQP